MLLYNIICSSAIDRLATEVIIGKLPDIKGNMGDLKDERGSWANKLVARLQLGCVSHALLLRSCNYNIHHQESVDNCIKKKKKTLVYMYRGLG